MFVVPLLHGVTAITNQCYHKTSNSCRQHPAAATAAAAGRQAGFSVAQPASPPPCFPPSLYLALSLRPTGLVLFPIRDESTEHPSPLRMLQLDSAIGRQDN